LALVVVAPMAMVAPAGVQVNIGASIISVSPPLAPRPSIMSSELAVLVAVAVLMAAMAPIQPSTPALLSPLKVLVAPLLVVAEPVVRAALELMETAMAEPVVLPTAMAVLGAVAPVVQMALVPLVAIPYSIRLAEVAVVVPILEALAPILTPTSPMVVLEEPIVLRVGQGRLERGQAVLREVQDLMAEVAVVVLKV